MMEEHDPTRCCFKATTDGPLQVSCYFFVPANQAEMQRDREGVLPYVCVSSQVDCWSTQNIEDVKIIEAEGAVSFIRFIITDFTEDRKVDAP